MVDIQEMYDRTVEKARDIESSVLVVASERSRGLQIGGDKKVRQVIEVEFGGPVPEEEQLSFLRMVNGTGWEFVDEDYVFEGSNDGNGLVSISRSVDPEDVPLTEFEEETYFDD